MTPNFDEETPRDSQRQHYGGHNFERELSIEKFIKNSTFDRFRSTPRSKKPKSCMKDTKCTRDFYQSKPTDYKEMSTPQKQKSSQRSYNYKEKENRNDVHLASNSRRKHSLSKSKAKIDNIFEKLNHHQEDVPENLDESILTRKSSQIYLKYKAMFDKNASQLDSREPSPIKNHEDSTYTIK